MIPVRRKAKTQTEIKHRWRLVRGIFGYRLRSAIFGSRRGWDIFGSAIWEDKEIVVSFGALCKNLIPDLGIHLFIDGRIVCACFPWDPMIFCIGMLRI